MRSLEFCNVGKIYKSKDVETVALNGVSFSVEEGESVSIIGKSGSGKSTLLHIAGGIDIPSSGDVYVNDVEINSMSQDVLTKFRRENIGLIYQFYNLVSVLSVVENIVLPLELAGKKAEKAKVDEILELLELKDRRHFFPNQLSGGQQQRVAIARAIIGNPPLILADEPTGNLDTENTANVMEALKLLNKHYKKTLIIVTHDPEVARTTNRVIMLSDGKIVKDERN